MNGEINQDYRFLKPILEEIRGKRVLDAGCGEGLYAELLAKKNTVWGIDDFSQKKNYPVWKSAVKGDVCDLPFEKESFALIVSIEVITHLPRDKQHVALNEFYRVLKHGGIAWISFHNAWRIKEKEGWIHPVFFNDTFWALEKIGLQPINWQMINFFQALNENMPKWKQIPLVFWEEVFTRMPGSQFLSTSILFKVKKT